MKIADKGPIDISTAHSIRGDSSVTKAGNQTRDRQAVQKDTAAQVSISPEARQLQKVVELSKRGDDLRAEKLQRIKGQIENGTYHVDATDVAKSAARHEISRLLGKQE